MSSRRAFVVGLSLLLVAGCKPAGKSKGDPYERVANGMNERQVIDIMGGRPAKRQKVTGGEAQGGEHYLYRWMERNRIITITFAEGLVVGKAIVK
ncbi:MAG: hypothetical protein JSS27_07610 [Planctomycetes bacterium]|nr:hypothetical protein [Planctomycetota bacterium]